MEGTSKRKVYIKQNFKDRQISVLDIQKMITNKNKQIADHIMRYDKDYAEHDSSRW